jgi:hypothetical protein
MTALAAERLVKFEQWTYREFTLTGVKGWKGGLAAISPGTGKITKASNVPGQKVIGRFNETIDASSTDKTVTVNFGREVPIVWYTNGTSGDAIAATDLGAYAYIKDDQTLTILPNGTNPVGVIWGYDSVKGVAIELIDMAAAFAPILIGPTLAFASNDLVLTAAQAVHGSTFDVPTTAGVSTVTLPVTGVKDGTTLTFVADGTKNGHTVQYRFGTTAISAALTASKIHRVTVTKLGSIWGATATAAP